MVAVFYLFFQVFSNSSSVNDSMNETLLWVNLSKEAYSNNPVCGLTIVNISTYSKFGNTSISVGETIISINNKTLGINDTSEPIALQLNKIIHEKEIAIITTDKGSYMIDTKENDVLGLYVTYVNCSQYN